MTPDSFIATYLESVILLDMGYIVDNEIVDLIECEISESGLNPLVVRSKIVDCLLHVRDTTTEINYLMSLIRYSAFIIYVRQCPVENSQQKINWKKEGF